MSLLACHNMRYTLWTTWRFLHCYMKHFLSRTRTRIQDSAAGLAPLRLPRRISLREVQVTGGPFMRAALNPNLGHYCHGFPSIYSFDALGSPVVLTWTRNTLHSPANTDKTKGRKSSYAQCDYTLEEWTVYHVSKSGILSPSSCHHRHASLHPA